MERIVQRAAKLSGIMHDLYTNIKELNSVKRKSRAIRSFSFALREIRGGYDIVTVYQLQGPHKILKPIFHITCGQPSVRTYRYTFDAFRPEYSTEDLSTEFLFQQSLVLNNDELFKLCFEAYASEYEYNLRYYMETLDYQTVYAAEKAVLDYFEEQEKYGKWR